VETVIRPKNTYTMPLLGLIIATVTGACSWQKIAWSFEQSGMKTSSSGTRKMMQNGLHVKNKSFP
jgi:hypothetical protein